MKCPHCGAELPAHASYCPSCGQPILRIRPKRVCTNCGAEVPEDADHCPGCGRPVRRKMPKDHTEKSDSAARTGAQVRAGAGRSAFRTMLRRDRYAWLQAVLPPVLAILYRLFLLRHDPGVDLLNTFLLLEGLIFFFGYLDIQEISKRPEMYDGAAFSSRYMYLSYFAPMLSLWERPKLPGMEPKALYAPVHTVLLTIFVAVYVFSSNGAVLLQSSGL